MAKTKIIVSRRVKRGTGRKESESSLGIGIQEVRDVGPAPKAILSERIRNILFDYGVSYKNEEAIQKILEAIVKDD